MKDKEFKAKNTDSNFAKEKVADTVLGRHNQENNTQKPFLASKKNRLYQQKAADLENAVEMHDNKISVSENGVSDTVNTQNENSVHIENDVDTQNLFSENTDVRVNETHFELPKTELFHSDSKTKAQRKQAQKFRQENNSAAPETQNAADPPIEKSDISVNSDIPVPSPLSHSDKYNIREVAAHTENAFDRISENEDFQFGRQENASPKWTHTDKNINARNKNRLYQKEQKRYDEKPQSVSSEQTAVSDSAKLETQDIPAVTEKSNATNAETVDMDIPETEDFQFERTRYEKRVDKAKTKADKAQYKLPHKKKIKRQRIYDEQKKKAASRLQFEKEVKPLTETNRRSFVKSTASFAGNGLINKAHQKIYEVEGDNSAVEAAHKTEQKAETLTRYSVRTAKYINGQRKSAPYKKAARLKVKAEKAEMKAIYEKTLAENPQFKKSAVKKFMQKQRIKKQYQKAKRTEHTAKTAKKAAQNTEKGLRRLATFIWRHKAVFGVILAIILLICWLGSVLSSCSVMGTMGANSLMVSSYFADDSDIYAAEDYYVGLEQALQSKIDNMESTYPNYDEHNYNLAGIGHNPYELISYLTAKYEDFKFNDVKSGLDALLNEQYHLTVTSRTEQRTDENGNAYTYKILNITLTNSGFTQSMNAEQQELYSIYLASKGNRDYLFADDIYSNVTQSPYNDYTILGEALTDATFRTLITEAEKYLGYPYVWGGSSPSTSFDCSGFVCYVFTHSSVYNLGRTTAQGIFDKCTAVRLSDAKPGDIIFFTGTYNSGCPVSHVGIYVGNGMMIHCGNPIQYVNINNSYWSQHFYAYGRLSN